MKILFIDESINRIGGVERVISTLANKLSFNNEVNVISVYKSSDHPFYNYNENIKISYLINSVKYKTNKMKSKNLKYYFFRIFEKIRDKLILKKNINKVIMDFDKYDVIVFGRVFTAIDFLEKMTFNVNSKIIVRDAIHLEYYPLNVKKKMYDLFPKYVNEFIVSSDESLKTYNDFFSLSSNQKLKIVKIYNPLGINPENKNSFKNKKIVSIGRLDTQKGFENLIKAFSFVSIKHPDWKLDIYGDGSYENVLRKVIRENNMTNYVKIHPSSKNVVDVFNNSSIFVLPSRYEGYANILVEALSCGMPSISFNWLMGVEEIIKDGVNGFVVPLNDRIKYFNGMNFDDDIVNLSKKIEYAIENEDICKKFGKEAEKIIETRNLETILEKWIKIIKE